MNIAIGKIGRSVSFDPNKWGPNGGDNEPPMLYLALAKFFPESKFYMVGRSDIKKNRKRIPKNIIDAWDGCVSKDAYDRFDYPYLRTKNIRFNGGILFAGLSTSFNIPTEDKKPLTMFAGYTAPVYHFLNKTKTPWMQLGPDPRYIMNGLDLENPPKYCFSQYNGTIEHTFINRHGNKEIISIPMGYNGLEKTYLIGMKPAEEVEKTTLFNIILNQGGNGGLDRGPELLRYIEGLGCKVWGKWDDAYYKDKRFKGPIDFRPLRRKILATKASFMIPTDIGWVTSKYWELVHAGVIPYMHPYYDQQKHLPFNEQLTMYSPEQLKANIEFADGGEKTRLEVVRKLRANIYPGDYTGEILANRVIKNFKEACEC